MWPSCPNTGLFFVFLLKVTTGDREGTVEVATSNSFLVPYTRDSQEGRGYVAISEMALVK